MDLKDPEFGNEKVCIRRRGSRFVAESSRGVKYLGPETRGHPRRDTWGSTTSSKVQKRRWDCWLFQEQWVFTGVSRTLGKRTVSSPLHPLSFYSVTSVTPIPSGTSKTSSGSLLFWYFSSKLSVLYPPSVLILCSSCVDISVVLYPFLKTVLPSYNPTIPIIPTGRTTCDTGLDLPFLRDCNSVPVWKVGR